MIVEIPEYESHYKVSINGMVINKNTGRILKPDFIKGYFRVTLSKNGISKRYFVHRLVLISFKGVDLSRRFVNHKDGNKINNHLSNLEWVTSSENERHSHRYLGKIPPECKTTLDLYTGIYYDSVTKAAIANSIKPSTLLEGVRLQRNKRFLCFN